jgi:hypothetical protein
LSDAARHRTFLLPFLFAIGALAAISVCGCGVPVAPGYKIQKESLTIHFISGNPPHLAIRADYRLANIGNSPLHFIPVELPGEKDFGFANLGAQIDGKDVAPQHNPHEDAEDWRIPLSTPWRQKEKINLALSYDLAASAPTDPRIFVAANTFYLNDSGWFPAFMGFKAFLSPSVTRPHSIDVSAVVPSHFLVTASGQLRGEKKHAGEIEHRFRIGKSDFNPYVLAGQYQQQIVSTAGVTVAIWTFKPIPADQAQKTAAQIAATGKFYVQNFGPLPSSVKAIYDIQPSEKVSAENLDWGRLLPGVVYDWTLDPSNSLGADLNSFISGVTGRMQLGNTWFGHMIVADPEAWILGGGLSEYAWDILDEGKTASSRADAVHSILAAYDDERSKAVEKSIISLTSAGSQDQLQIGGDKMQLFFFALEDKCGQQNVTHAIAHMVYALRGGEYGYPEFRSALEQQCHQDLAEFFRTWLAKPGIPPDFRARYDQSGGVK